MLLTNEQHLTLTFTNLNSTSTPPYSTACVCVLQITLPFQLLWLLDSFFEFVTVTFFILTGYMFRPASNNPYFQLLADGDDENDVDEMSVRTLEMGTRVLDWVHAH